MFCEDELEEMMVTSPDQVQQLQLVVMPISTLLVKETKNISTVTTCMVLRSQDIPSAVLASEKNSLGRLSWIVF